MSGESMRKMWIVSIHDRHPAGYLAFDVIDIIDAILPKVSSYYWIALDVDWIGGSIREGETMTTFELKLCLANVVQIIDGIFLGYNTLCPELDRGKAAKDYAHFPDSDADIAIVAVDGSFFEVYTKDAEIIRLLRDRFVDVREEDVSNYFDKKN
jgi:formylmethanofuran dehydrogenase subunit E